MKIKLFAVGNKDEAYIEDRFTDGINIISSDENNKGKTIVLQSIMYALGNEPIFPSSFQYKDYYHYIEFEKEDGNIVTICRKQDSYVISFNNSLHIFDSLSEFKHYINAEQFSIPTIAKDGIKKLVDPMLLYQVFFIGQDNKDTSNIFLKGYYNKNDFINMLYSMKGINPIDSSWENEFEIKKRIKNLKNEKKNLITQFRILESVLDPISIASKSNDKSIFEEKIKKIDKIKNQIIKLQKKRNTALSRKTKNEITLKELRSLNRTLIAGELTCLDCDSNNIGYSTADKSYTFDISSTEIRSQILSSIQNRIDTYEEEINSTTTKINYLQDDLQELLAVDEVSLQSLLLYKDDLVNASTADTSIIEIEKKISELELILKEINSTSDDIKNNKQELISKILEEMNNFYKLLEPSGNFAYDGIFSTRTSVYSGCEETEFYLSKLYSLKKILNHPFPIIVDSFRDGELSSSKENIVLEEFNKFDSQVIFTATLKDQEISKYDSLTLINHINYIDNAPYKLLNSSFCSKFNDLLKKVSLS